MTVFRFAHLKHGECVCGEVGVVETNLALWEMIGVAFFGQGDSVSSLGVTC